MDHEPHESELQEKPQEVASSLRSFEETVDQEIRPYEVIDQEGNIVQMQRKNKAKHESSFTDEGHPTVFLNLGVVIQTPDSVEDSKSMNPEAVSKLEKGTIKNFHKKGFMKALDLPGGEYSGDETMRVVVFYGNEEVAKPGDPKNYSLTYYLLR